MKTQKCPLLVLLVAACSPTPSHSTPESAPTIPATVAPETAAIEPAPEVWYTLDTAEFSIEFPSEPQHTETATKILGYQSLDDTGTTTFELSYLDASSPNTAEIVVRLLEPGAYDHVDTTWKGFSAVRYHIALPDYRDAARLDIAVGSRLYFLSAISELPVSDEDADWQRFVNSFALADGVL